MKSSLLISLNCNLNIEQMIVVLALSLGLMACTNVEVSQQSESTVVKALGIEFCTAPPEDKNVVTKYLFIVDRSGSNVWNDPNSVADYLDPEVVEKFPPELLSVQHLRLKALNRFVDEQVDPNIEYGVIFFCKEAWSPVNTGSEGQPEFTSDRSRIKEAFAGILTDGRRCGGTRYVPPLRTAISLVERDQAIEKAESGSTAKTVNYVSFLLSDGYHHDDLLDIENSVKEFISIDPSHIYLSSGYYGGRDAYGNRLDQPIESLKSVAELGNGRFLDFTKGEEIDFGELIVGPNKDPWFVKHFLIYNVNAGFCLDGSIGTDSDSDGMCDQDEIDLSRKGLKFDPQNRFSFGDGYSDLFHWRRHVFGVTLPTCDDRSDIDGDLLTACEESAVYAIGDQQSGTNFANELLPDSDFDGILDGIEVMVYYSISLAYPVISDNLSQNYLDFESDDAGTQITQHRSPLVADKDAYAHLYSLTPKPVRQGGQICYNLAQENYIKLYDTLTVEPTNTLPGLSHAQGENKIFSYFMQAKQANPTKPKALRSNINTLKYGAPDRFIEVEGSDFGTYLIPNLDL